MKEEISSDEGRLVGSSSAGTPSNVHQSFVFRPPSWIAHAVTEARVLTIQSLRAPDSSEIAVNSNLRSGRVPTSVHSGLSGSKSATLLMRIFWDSGSAKSSVRGGRNSGALSATRFFASSK